MAPSDSGGERLGWAADVHGEPSPTASMTAAQVPEIGVGAVHADDSRELLDHAADHVHGLRYPPTGGSRDDGQVGGGEDVGEVGLDLGVGRPVAVTELQ